MITPLFLFCICSSFAISFLSVIEDHIVKLQNNYMIFVQDVNCKTDILDYLYEIDVINTEEKEEILTSALTRYDSNRMLYSKLVRKGETAYLSLCKALRHGAYSDIASSMEDTKISDHEKQLCQIGINHNILKSWMLLNYVTSILTYVASSSQTLNNSRELK